MRCLTLLAERGNLRFGLWPGRSEFSSLARCIAAPLRRETTMTLEWIGERLCMGVAAHVAYLLQRHEQRGVESEETLF